MTEDVGRRWFDPYAPVPKPVVEEEDEFNHSLIPGRTDDSARDSHL
jgi:hypothetical protein